jgi:hypothetical protein
MSTAIRNYYAEKSDTPIGSAASGRSLAELKASSPAYANLSDQEFASRIYRKHYADKMSFEDYARRIGLDNADQTSGAAHPYSVDQLYQKLERADAAGDTEAAHVIADEIRRMQGTSRPDFGNVQSSASTVRVAPAPKAPSIGERLSRDLGLGVRASLEGIGSTIGIFSDPLAAGADKLANVIAPPQSSLSGLVSGQQPQPRRIFGTAREGFSGLADLMHLPHPETPLERVSGDVTGALAGGGGLMGAGRTLALKAPGWGRAAGEFLSSHPAPQIASLLAGSTASGVTREAGGSEGAQSLAGIAASFGPGAASYTGEAGLLRLLRGGEAGRKQVASAIDDFASVGATPSVGQATGNWRTQSLESLLGGGPTSAGVMTRFAEHQAEDISRGLARQGNSLSPRSSAENAGRAIEQGAELFKRNTDATKKGLYWAVDQQIPDATPVSLGNTWQKVVDLTTPNAGASATTGAMVNPKIAALRSTLEEDLAANGGHVTYDALKRIRTTIGEAISDYSLSPDTPTREYKALYAALSRDMEDAAKARGPLAVEAAKRANGYTRAAANRLELVDRAVQKAGGPEKVFLATMSGTKDGATTLRAVMQSLPQDGQKAVTAAVIRRMGLAMPGSQDAAGEVFSASTFLRRWNDISPEAKRALFDRYGLGFSANMDKIARVAQRIRDGSKVLANPAGTAPKAVSYGYWASVAGAALTAPFTGAVPLVALLGGGLGANVAARVLTNPRLVSWLATNAEKPVGSALGSLVNLAQVDSDAAELYRALKQSEQENRSRTAPGQSLPPR